jgi:hypothetical protein
MKDSNEYYLIYCRNYKQACKKTVFEDRLKIDRATEGLRQQFITRLTDHRYRFNALTIANFLLAAKTESNISDGYREDLIFTLCSLR